MVFPVFLHGVPSVPGVPRVLSVCCSVLVPSILGVAFLASQVFLMFLFSCFWSSSYCFSMLSLVGMCEGEQSSGIFLNRTTTLPVVRHTLID